MASVNAQPKDAADATASSSALVVVRANVAVLLSSRLVLVVMGPVSGSAAAGGAVLQ